MERYHEILSRYWGYTEFRPLQLDVIKNVCAGHDTIALMPTGGGKSLTYQIPGLAADGVCVVITPLIALMKDQVDRLRSKGILAVGLHAGMRTCEIDRMLDNCVYGDYKFLYVSPERAQTELFRARLARMNVNLIAVDEAHCISEWGFDFRPSYLKINELRALAPEAPFLALTASATESVVGDIQTHLELRNPSLLRMSFARDSLSYIVRRTEDKHGQLLRILKSVAGSAIVYVRSRDKSETIAKFLSENGLAADYYHAGLNHPTRSLKQDLWKHNKIRIIVATNAFGMGIDKPDVRIVIHFDVPESIEAYYQEAGRAGRDNHPAFAVLLSAPNDTSDTTKRIALEFPPLDTVRAIYEALFNYLQISFGEGNQSAFNFDIYDFAFRYKYFVPVVQNAIKILSLNGYMTLSDEIDHPSRIQFLVERDRLYHLRSSTALQDTLLKTILRLYPGLFSELRPIHETEIAQTSGTSVQQVHDFLKILWRQRIIRYIPGRKCPLLYLATERLTPSNLHISPESYTTRKNTLETKTKALFQYLENTSECRSLLLQHYFGDFCATPCGKCDVCRQKRELGNTLNSHTASINLRSQILSLLTEKTLESKALSEIIPAPSALILQTIQELLAEGLIVQLLNGKLQKNTGIQV